MSEEVTEEVNDANVLKAIRLVRMALDRDWIVDDCRNHVMSMWCASCHAIQLDDMLAALEAEFDGDGGDE